MRIRLNLRHLEAILAVHDQGNFSNAAEHLHISQPALSRTIQLAEDAVGTRIFDRDSRSVRMTPSGQELVRIARRIVGEFNDSMSELSLFMEGHRGRIRIGALPSMAPSIVAESIARFGETYPNVDFSIRVESAGNILELLDAGAIDVGMTVQPPPDVRFTFTHLDDDDFVLVCRPDDPIVQGRSTNDAVEWGAFSGRHFIASPAGTNTRAVTDQAFEEAGVKFYQRHKVESNDVLVVGGLVSAGLGISALPRSTVRCLNQERLATIRLTSPVAIRHVGVVTLIERTNSQALDNFVKAVRALHEFNGRSP